MCSLSMNWTSGGWAFHPVSLLLLGTGATRSPYGPWVLSAALPLGAVWFLLKRKGYLRRVADESVCANGGAGIRIEPDET
jgi:hypothetical protein